MYYWTYIYYTCINKHIGCITAKSSSASLKGPDRRRRKKKKHKKTWFCWLLTTEKCCFSVYILYRHSNMGKNIYTCSGQYVNFPHWADIAKQLDFISCRSQPHTFTACRIELTLIKWWHLHLLLDFHYKRVLKVRNVHIRCKAAYHAVGSKTEGGRVFRSAPALCCVDQSSDPCERHLLKGNGADLELQIKSRPFCWIMVK